MDSETVPDKLPTSRVRRKLLLDLVVFQVKLAADGIRDLILSPLSLLFAIAGLLVPGDDPGRYFYRLLRAGRRTDHWINLFVPFSQQSKLTEPDRYIDEAASMFVREYEKALTDERAGKTAGDGAPAEHRIDAGQQNEGDDPTTDPPAPGKLQQPSINGDS